MKNEINILPGDRETLIIREGKALDLQPPQQIEIAGDIDTVKNFVKKRYQPTFFTAKTIVDSADRNGPMEAAEIPKTLDKSNFQHIDKERAVISFDKTNLSITLDVNPQDYYGPVVIGKMEISPELKLWQINTNCIFTREQLVKLIKFNKRFFTDAAQHDSVLKAFQNLSLTGNTSLDASADTRGNKAAAFTKKLDTSGIPTMFFLKMPIFKNGPAVKFQVEICIDSTEHSVQFWFESVELQEVWDKIVDTIFEEQKKEFTDFVIVNK